MRRLLDIFNKSSERKRNRALHGGEDIRLEDWSPKRTNSSHIKLAATFCRCKQGATSGNIRGKAGRQNFGTSVLSRSSHSEGDHLRLVERNIGLDPDMLEKAEAFMIRIS